jgi:protein TonB
MPAPPEASITAVPSTLIEPSAWISRPPPPPPPPPPRAEAPKPVEVVNPNAAPIEAPSEIKPETGIEAGFESAGGVEGGIIGGVAGGITGGIPEPPPPPPPPAAPVRVGGNIKTPVKTRDVKPVYPPIAQSARVQGIVIIEATIGPDGAVKDAKVLRSIPLLDQAALDAVRQWQFTPTLLNGVPVPVIMTVTVQFTLQ